MSGALLIRRAVPADVAALRRLAALDDARPLRGDALVALVGGDLRAALALADGRVIADPFMRTAELVEMLRVRATQVEATAKTGGGLPLVALRLPRALTRL